MTEYGLGEEKIVLVHTYNLTRARPRGVISAVLHVLAQTFLVL